MGEVGVGVYWPRSGLRADLGAAVAALAQGKPRFPPAKYEIGFATTKDCALKELGCLKTRTVDILPACPYAAKDWSRITCKTRLKAGSGTLHMVRYVSRKGSQSHVGVRSRHMGYGLFRRHR